MKVRFWGTRGSLPKPGPSTLRYGGNTSCVELQSAAGTRIVLDCGSGAHNLGQALMAMGRGPLCGHILISHTHWDHIQGLPFFAPLFVPGNEWDIYGPYASCGSLQESLAGQMQYTYFPITLRDFGATLRYHDLMEGCFSIDDVVVRTQYLNHPALTLGYRIEADGVSIVYACDHEPHSRQLANGSGDVIGQDRHHADFLADADLVIHDGQYVAEEYANKIGWGHSTVEYVLRMCRLAGAKRLAITHHDPLRSDDALDQIIEAIGGNGQSSQLEVFAAAEGKTIEFAQSTEKTAVGRLGNINAEPEMPAVLPDQSILLVASEPMIVKSITEAVQADNVRVMHAEDGPAALHILGGERASLVILEHQPPQVNALETCRAIRSFDTRLGEIPVILVASAEDEALGADAGVTDWLLKPYSEVYARTKLRAWLMRVICRWIRAQIPGDEVKRLTALHELGILDTAPEERFDRITRLAAALFDVPIALISLVDRERQWFKSCIGLEARETSREVSFCAHVIVSREAMVVPDTLLDVRFADNPLVSGDPRIRFYAGYPLILPDNSCVGTLCLIDIRPRLLDETKVALLGDLRDLVQQELSAEGR